MSGSKEDNTKFYRETISAVSITYRACDTVSEDGNVSQLGINVKVELPLRHRVFITQWMWQD